MGTTPPTPLLTDSPQESAPHPLRGDHPAWCPGCGDFAVLACFCKAVENLRIAQEKLCIVAGGGCSSRLPYFLNVHGVHFIQGRAIPFAAGISLARPDLQVVVFGGEQEGFSIGGDHLDYAARKNVKLTYIIVNNAVNGGAGKKTSPSGCQATGHPWGSGDQQPNPPRRLLASGASFVARTHAAQIKHVTSMFERALRHPGFSAVEVLSECLTFSKGAFDAANPRKGGRFVILEDKTEDGSPADQQRHDPNDRLAALRLCDEPWPGRFGVYYAGQHSPKDDSEPRPTDPARATCNGTPALELLKARFEGMR